MERKHCFVISPIGEEASEIRRHADDVFDYIIKPAMDTCDIDVLRSDQVKTPGKITDQMFEALTSDLCIAVLTGRNPNVFYELAIAQAAARPVVLMMEKGNVLPFDIEHLRCVYYDLDIRSFHERVYIDELVEHVRSLEKSGWVVASPFGAVTPLKFGRTDRGYETRSTSLDFFAATSQHSSIEEWSGAVEHTDHEFDLLDLVPWGWECSDRVRLLFQKKAAEGCRIRFLTAHPDNPALPMLYDSEVSAMAVDEAEATLAKTGRFFSRLASETEGVEFRQMRRGVTHVQVTRLDRHVTVVPYLTSVHSEYLPLWHAPTAILSTPPRSASSTTCGRERKRRRNGVTT